MAETVNTESAHSESPVFGTRSSTVLVLGVSVVMLALEILLPRFLIFRFRGEALNILLIIAITMLGLAFGGLIAFALRTETARARAVAVSAALVPITILAGYLALARLSVASLAIACVVPPFIATGVILTVFFIYAPSHTIYAANLIGSGLGAFLGIGFLAPLGGEQLLFAIGTLAGVLAVGWAWRQRHQLAITVIAGVGLLASVGAFVANAQTGVLDMMRLLVPGEAPADPYLFGTHARVHPDTRHLGTRWDLVSRVDAFATPSHDLRHKYMTDALLRGPDTPLKREYTEALSGTVKLYFDNKFWTLIPDHERVFAATGPYALLTEPRVLVIGVGGGVDIAKARYAGASRIVGVEINQAVVDLMTTTLSSHDKGQYAAAEMHVMDGRTFVHLSQEQFDLIMISFADLYVPFGKSDIFLENYLYTVEAFGDYYEHLAPGGVINVSKTLSTAYGHFELLRVVATTLAYFRSHEIPHPGRHLFVTGYPTRTRRTGGSVLIKKEPFTADEVARLTATVHPPFAVVHSPLRHIANSPYADLVYASSPRDFFEKFPYDVRPITDDRPYFYLFDKEMAEHRSDMWMFLKVLALGALLPALVLMFRDATVRVLPVYRGLVYFATIAVGFMAAEGVLVQKVSLFIGSPVPALAVVLVVLLVGGGIGSWLSGRMEPRRLRGVFVLIPALMLGVAWGLPLVFRYLAVASLSGRAAIVGVCLAPVAVCLGMPFPSMLRQLRDQVSQASAALLFAVNGACSALTVMLVMFYAPQVGLTVFLYVAAILYAAAAGLYALEVRQA